MVKEQDSKLDKLDIGAAIASGTLTAAIDIVWVGEFSFEKAHEMGKEQVEKFVIKAARCKGYKGNDLLKAVEKLEGKSPMVGDKLTGKFGGGLNHHLRDFSHHPTPVGLFFFVLMELTGKGYGTNTKGDFCSYDVPGWSKQDDLQALFKGILNWLFHMISDVAGSSGSIRDGKEGTGIPGPLLSFLKEISSISGIKEIAGKSEKKTSNLVERYNFSEICTKLFNGTFLGEHDENGNIVKNGKMPFDLRTEIGIVCEVGKQTIPIILNEVIVSALYTLKKFVLLINESEINNLSDLSKLDVHECLPWNSDRRQKMRLISTATFTSIDISAAGIAAAIKNKGNSNGFAFDFIKRINFWGVGIFILTSDGKLKSLMENLYDEFILLAEQQKQNLISAISDGEEVFDTSKFTVNTVMSIAKLGTPLGFTFATIGVYDEIKKSLDDLKLAKEERVRIEEECEARIEIIKEYREEMNAVVSDYLYQKMYMMGTAFDQMDHAITEDDIEMYILGSNMIQKELSGKVIFENEKGFDELMMSDSNIKF